MYFFSLHAESNLPINNSFQLNFKLILSPRSLAHHNNIFLCTRSFTLCPQEPNKLQNHITCHVPSRLSSQPQQYGPLPTVTEWIFQPPWHGLLASIYGLTLILSYESFTLHFQQLPRPFYFPVLLGFIITP